MSELLTAALLGIVEGLTEFLPVSSTGHLILAGDLLAFTGSKANTFEVFIQLGAILAVVVLYWHRFIGFLQLSRPTSLFQGWGGIVRVGVATVPALICGALFHSTIKAVLFSPAPVAVALILGGVVMVLIERARFLSPRTGTVDEITLKQSFAIGVVQCLSLWPGMSRSGSTIIGGMVCGLERRVAAEFSFVVAVPVMLAAVSYDLLKNASQLSQSDLPLFAVGFVVSFFTAILAIRFFVSLLGRWTLRPFGYYRIALGVLVLLVTR